jgi:hypothetical protein
VIIFFIPIIIIILIKWRRKPKDKESKSNDWIILEPSSN